MSPIAIFLTLALLFAGNEAASRKRQGDSGNSPGNSGNAPGNSGNTPGNSGSAPGQNSVSSCATAYSFFDQNYTDCNAIPNATFPTAWQWALNSPYTFDYSIGTQFKCAQETFTMPKFGDTSYSGSAIVTSFNTALTFNYNMSADATYVSAYVCGQDPATSSVFWYPVAYESNNAGSFYCAKMCQGSAFLEFVCLSNSNAFATQIAKIVAAVKGVTNGDKILPAQADCAAKGISSCQAFYSSVSS